MYIDRTVGRRQCIALQGLTSLVRLEFCLCVVVSNRARHFAILMACVSPSSVLARGYGAKSSTSVYTVQYAHNEPVSWAVWNISAKVQAKVVVFGSCVNTQMLRCSILARLEELSFIGHV